MNIATFHKDMFDIGNTFLINFSTSLFYNICTNKRLSEDINKSNKIDLLEIIREASLNSQSTIITYLFSVFISKNYLLNLIIGYTFTYLKYGVSYSIRYGIINGVWYFIYNKAIRFVFNFF